MQKIYHLLFLCLAMVGASCSGVKNMSGSLSKSDGRSGTDNSRHGDYLNSGTTRYDTVRTQQSVMYQPVSGNAGVASDLRNSDIYRKDYGRLADPASTYQNPSSISNSVQDYNQKLVNQYAEMDRLGDVIVFELEILDRRWSQLLEQFRTANNQDREIISRELDKLNADQLGLYKNYTKIYKNGKTDWPRVKNEVETALMNLRGMDKK